MTILRSLRTRKNLMPYGDWRPPLIAAVENGVSSEERRSILVEAFSENLRNVGRYKYICETTVFRPEKDRALYNLFYGTRHEVGLEVFRDCHVKAISAQSKTRQQTKLSNASIQSGQGELFALAHEMAPDREAQPFLEDQRRAAKEFLLAASPMAPQSKPYGQLWPMILEKAVLKKTDLNLIAAELKKAVASISQIGSHGNAFRVMIPSCNALDECDLGAPTERPDHIHPIPGMGLSVRGGRFRMGISS